MQFHGDYGPGGGFQAGVIVEAVYFQPLDGFCLGGEGGEACPVPDRPLGDEDLLSLKGSPVHLLDLVEVGCEAAWVGAHLRGSRRGSEPQEPAVQFQRRALQQG